MSTHFLKAVLKAEMDLKPQSMATAAIFIRRRGRLGGDKSRQPSRSLFPLQFFAEKGLPLFFVNALRHCKGVTANSSATVRFAALVRVSAAGHL